MTRLFTAITLFAALLFLNQCNKNTPIMAGGGSDTENAFVQGYLYDDIGKVAANAGVVLYAKQYNPVGNFLDTIAVTTTDSNGFYSIKNVTADETYLLKGSDTQKEKMYFDTHVAQAGYYHDTLRIPDTCIFNDVPDRDSVYLYFPRQDIRLPLDSQTIVYISNLPKRTYIFIDRIPNESLPAFTAICNRSLLEDLVILLIYKIRGSLYAPFSFQEDARKAGYEYVTWFPRSPDTSEIKCMAIDEYNQRILICYRNNIKAFSKTGELLGVVISDSNINSLTLTDRSTIFASCNQTFPVSIIRKYTNGVLSMQISNYGDSVSPLPWGHAATDKNGNIYVMPHTFFNGERPFIQKFDPSGKPIARWDDTNAVHFENTNYLDGLNIGYQLDVDKVRGIVYMLNPGNSRILRFDTAGSYLGDITGLPYCSFNVMRLAPNGNIYVATYTQITAWSPDGRLLISLPSHFFGPGDMCISSEGVIYLVNGVGNWIDIYYPESLHYVLPK